MQSIDLGASEGSNSAEGTSMSLQGSGFGDESFAWAAGVAATPGALNTGQTVVAPEPSPPSPPPPSPSPPPPSPPSTAAPVGTAPSPAPARGALPPPWINELHYDNDGTDLTEFIEVALPIAGPAEADVSVALYNGNDGAPYW